MKVLLLTQFYPPDIGGEERHVQALGNTLAARGHTVTVATQTLTGEPTVTDEGDVRVHRIRSTTAPVVHRHRVPHVLTLHDYGHVCPTHRLMQQDDSVCGGPRLSRCMPCAIGHYGPLKGILTTAAHRGTSLLRSHALSHIIAVSNDVAARNGLREGRTPWSVVPRFEDIYWEKVGR
jgi:hypothetical protein